MGPVNCKTVFRHILNMTVIEENMSVDESRDDSSFTEDNSMVDKTPAIKRKKKKRPRKGLIGATFDDLYKLTCEPLGAGSYGKVETCKNVFTGIEYAVKIIEKIPGSFSRSKLLKEIEIYHLCRGQRNIIQLIEYFEETDKFYLVFEKINGGPLLKQIQQRICFTEAEASMIIKDLAEAIRHLHKQGIAHRDIKPDNVLCVNTNYPCPVKLCDFDLSSEASKDVSTPELLTPVGSLEYMAPEVVNIFKIHDYDYDDDDDEEEAGFGYNKKCDMWSLGIIAYILLCGYAPFSGNCFMDCGWEKGESCPECQEMLFSCIKEGEVVFPEQHWSEISKEAKDIVENLLVKDSSKRLNAEQVLNHPWIVQGGSPTALLTPTNLQSQVSIKNLETLSNRTMVSSIVIKLDTDKSTSPIDILWKREAFSFNLSPPNISSCSLLQRRRKSKEKLIKFGSIDELETDFFMKTIC